jgi:hypothetical protein
MTTRADLEKLQEAASSHFSWADLVPLHGGEERLLALGTSGSGITSA